MFPHPSPLFPKMSWKDPLDYEYNGSSCDLNGEVSDALSEADCQTACDNNPKCFVAQFKGGDKNKVCTLKNIGSNDCFQDSYPEGDDQDRKYYFRFNRTTRDDIKNLLSQTQSRETLLKYGATNDQLAYLDDWGEESEHYNGSYQSDYSTYDAVVEEQTAVDKVMRYSSNNTAFDEVSPDPKFDVATYNDITTLPNPWVVQAPALGCGFLPTDGGEWGGSYDRGGKLYYPGVLPETLGPSNA